MSSTNIVVTVNSGASTSITPLGLGALTGPAAAGAIVCALGIAPITWNGTLSLSGANASAFAISGQNLIVGSSPLAAGTYDVTVTATP